MDTLDNTVAFPTAYLEHGTHGISLCACLCFHLLADNQRSTCPVTCMALLLSIVVLGMDLTRQHTVLKPETADRTLVSGQLEVKHYVK